MSARAPASRSGERPPIFDGLAHTRATVDLEPGRSEHFPYRQRVFVWDELPLVYFDEGSGPAVLLVHGLGANLTHFEFVAPSLVAAGFRVCGLDLPGFGLSAKPERRYTIPFLADATLALLDHLDLERATLGGHSLGGLVVADAALRAPARVERLVLINSAGFFRLPLALRLAAHTFLSRPELVAHAIQHSAPRLLERVFEERNERTERFIEQGLSRPSERFVRDFARVVCGLKRDLTTYHLLDAAERLTMPTLVVWGERDRLLPFRPVPRFCARLPNGRLEVIKRCGHMPIIENPSAVLAAMLPFLPHPLPSAATSPLAAAPVRPARPSGRS